MADITPCVKSKVAVSTCLFSIGFTLPFADFMGINIFRTSIGVRMWNLLATAFHVNKRGFESPGTTFNLH